MTGQPPRDPAFPPGTVVTWRAGHVTLRGTVVTSKWVPEIHTHVYALENVTGAAITTAQMPEGALHRAPTERTP